MWFTAWMRKTRMNSLLQQLNEHVAQYAVAAMWDRVAVKPKSPIDKWVSSTIDLSYDATSAGVGKVALYPYQVEPLLETEKPGTREVTLMWGQRLGKSTIWKFSLLKRLFDGGLSGLIVYPSMEMGLKTNKDTVLPLLRTLPNLKADLAAIGGRKKDSYHLPSARSVLYFIGGGAQIVSYTANWGVLDEADFIKIENADAEGQNVDQLRSLRLRMQTFPRRMLIACSSPTNYGGCIYQNWKSGSRGVWNFACLECGALFPTSQLAFPKADGSYAGLQWQKNDAGDVIEESIRWICPACGHAHVFGEAAEMNRRGRYLHDNGNRTDHRSFQAGALANPALWPWLQIAEAQEMAVDSDGRKFLANTIKGMPYKHVREGDLSISIPDVLASKKVAYPPDLSSRISIVCAGIDQQSSGLGASKYYVYAVRGWDEHGNSWSLAAGVANSIDELNAVVETSHCGLPVALALIDQGGFEDNAQRTDPFVRSHANVLYYKGGDDRTNSLKGRRWKPSENQQGLILANAVAYQVKLLDLLYGPPRPNGYRWYIPEDASPAYLEQLGAMQPNNRMKSGNGDAFSNWTPSSVRHDYFDAEKMALAALDVACRYLPATRFRRGAAPLFVRAEMLRAIALQKMAANS